MSTFVFPEKAIKQISTLIYKSNYYGVGMGGTKNFKAKPIQVFYELALSIQIVIVNILMTIIF